MSTPQGGARLGTRFGPYELHSVIGVGGMGEVYRAYDTARERMVAIKLLRPEMAADRSFQDRFRRESRVAARLQEPHVIPVHNFGEIDGQLYIDMRLVEGASLKEVLRHDGPLPPARAVAILRQVAAALDDAHANGLVHRDIKPENILISDDGEVKIADFGLVRAVAEAKITSTSVILGTAAYLSPEQVATGETDSRGDVYSVGILVYELLTGRTPFTGDTSLAVAYQRMDRDVPPPSTAIRGVPRQFDDLVQCATARDPEQRFADAAEMADQLETVVRELDLPHFRVPAPKNSAAHTSATTGTSSAATTVVRDHTKVFGRDELPVLDDGYENGDEDEYPSETSHFAGIEMEHFYWARQRARRVLLFWVILVITLAGLAAAGAWTLGANLPNLL